MNVGMLVEWGGRDAGGDERWTEDRSIWGRTVESVRTKLGWLNEFSEELEEWSAYQGMIRWDVETRALRGLTVSGGREMEATLPSAAGGVGELHEELIEFWSTNR